MPCVPALGQSARELAAASPGLHPQCLLTLLVLLWILSLLRLSCEYVYTLNLVHPSGKSSIREVVQGTLDTVGFYSMVTMNINNNTALYKGF